MTVLTTSTARLHRNNAIPYFAKYTMTASTTIFEGAIVAVTSTTQAALNATDAAGIAVVGIATMTRTSAASGTTLIEVMFGHDELLQTNVTMLALVGSPAVVFDNDVVTSVAGGTNDAKVGVVKEFVSATRSWITILGVATI